VRNDQDAEDVVQERKAELRALRFFEGFRRQKVPGRGMVRKHCLRRNTAFTA